MYSGYGAVGYLADSAAFDEMEGATLTVCPNGFSRPVILWEAPRSKGVWLGTLQGDREGAILLPGNLGKSRLVKAVKYSMLS